MVYFNDYWADGIGSQNQMKMSILRKKGGL
jgi:hypothetical protein